MKLDMNLQEWSLFVSHICDRTTPYEELSEFDQVSDRLVLESVETLLDHLSQEAQAECVELIRGKAT